ncbi:MAG: DUF1295 domain-containing protein [Polyangiaceae bacterium]|nr:DUF1295 domain-containing protein [Polyangiaceae bacterium]
MSRYAFTALVLVVAAQRLCELSKSKRNEARIIAAGGREHAPEQMWWMRMLHAGWLAGMLVEVWLFDAALPGWLAVVALAAFFLGQALRLSAMRALGPRWTVKIMTVPGHRAVDTGIFRYIRHPNYLGVVLELAALPIVHGAFVTAGVASVLNGLLLRARIRAEERALDEDSAYRAIVGDRPRFLPRFSRSAVDG